MENFKTERGPALNINIRTTCIALSLMLGTNNLHNLLCFTVQCMNLRDWGKEAFRSN